MEEGPCIPLRSVVILVVWNIDSCFTASPLQTRNGLNAAPPFVLYLLDSSFTSRVFVCDCTPYLYVATIELLDSQSKVTAHGFAWKTTRR